MSVTRGAYLLSGHDGPFAVERFTCGPADGGWRYDAVRDGGGRLELSLSGGTTRLHAEAAGWVLRAAAAGGEVVWRRGDEERVAAADGLTGSSPAFVVVCAARAQGRLHLLEVTEPVLATRTTTQQWSRLPPEEHDGVTVDVWRVDDLSTGERRTVRLAGDVVVEAPGVRLLELG